MIFRVQNLSSSRLFLGICIFLQNRQHTTDRHMLMDTYLIFILIDTYIRCDSITWLGNHYIFNSSSLISKVIMKLPIPHYELWKIVYYPKEDAHFFLFFIPNPAFYFCSSDNWLKVQVGGFGQIKRKRLKWKKT